MTGRRGHAHPVRRRWHDWLATWNDGAAMYVHVLRATRSVVHECPECGRPWPDHPGTA